MQLLLLSEFLNLAVNLCCLFQESFFLCCIQYRATLWMLCRDFGKLRGADSLCTSAFPKRLLLSQKINLWSLLARKTMRSSEDSLTGEERHLFCGSERRERANGRGDGEGGKDTPLTERACQGEAPTRSQLEPANTSMHSPWGEWELTWCASVRCKMNELLFSGVFGPRRWSTSTRLHQVHLHHLMATYTLTETGTSQHWLGCLCMTCLAFNSCLLQQKGKKLKKWQKKTLSPSPFHPHPPTTVLHRCSLCLQLYFQSYGLLV